MIDSGYTSHIEVNEPKFVKFQESFDPQNHYIELADGQRQQGTVQGVGDVKDCIQDREGNSRSSVKKMHCTYQDLNKTSCQYGKPLRVDTSLLFHLMAAH